MNAGFKIHYTTDGSTPTAESKEYTQPFALESGMVKAVALLNNEREKCVSSNWDTLKGMEDQTGKTYCGDSAGRPSLFHIRTDVYSTDNDAMPMSVKGSVKFSENGKTGFLQKHLNSEI